MDVHAVVYLAISNDNTFRILHATLYKPAIEKWIELWNKDESNVDHKVHLETYELDEGEK